MGFEFREGRFTHPFMQLLVLAMLSLAFFVLAVFLGALCGMGIGDETGSRSLFIVWQAVSQVLMFGLPPVVVAVLYCHGETAHWLRLDFSGRRWLLALAGVVVMLLLVPLTDWLTVWNDNWHWSGAWAPIEQTLRRVGEESQATVESVMRECHPLLSLLCIALVPAVCEELFFRAGVQNLLQRWWSRPGEGRALSGGGVHVAVWVTAAIFSLAHGEVFAFLPRFLLGALLGYLYVHGNSLLINVMVHFVNNAAVVLLFWMAPPSSGIDPSAPLAIGWTVTLACSVAAVILFVVTFGKGLKISK